MGRSRGYVHRVDVRAEATEVWAALIDPAIVMRWHVSNARVDAREGGSYWTRLGPKFEREAHIDIFLPPQRLRLLYMPAAGLPDTGVVPIDDFLLDRDAAASRATGSAVTVVRLMGSGIPDSREWDAMYVRLRGGWERSLLRLKALYERSGESTREAAEGGAGAPQRSPVQDGKAIEWPEPGKNKKSPPADDFIPWPDPTPDKKR